MPQRTGVLARAAIEHSFSWRPIQGSACGPHLLSSNRVAHGNALPLRPGGVGPDPPRGPRRAGCGPRAGVGYIKRMVTHLMNVLSAVFMPLDRLDSFDEDLEDRADLRD